MEKGKERTPGSIWQKTPGEKQIVSDPLRAWLFPVMGIPYAAFQEPGPAKGYTELLPTVAT